MYKTVLFLNVFSETASAIFTIFHMEPSVKRVSTICSNGKKLLKYILLQNQDRLTATSSIPSLESNGCIYTDEQDKANLLNNYFEEQTFLDDGHAELPALPPYNIDSNLNSIILTL